MRAACLCHTNRRVSGRALWPAVRTADCLSGRRCWRVATRRVNSAVRPGGWDRLNKPQGQLDASRRQAARCAAQAALGAFDCSSGPLRASASTVRQGAPFGWNMKELCILAAVTCIAGLVCGLDPQPTANVWQSANHTRPWQNPAWATQGSQPPSGGVTPHMPHGNTDWPSLPGANQPSQQQGPTRSYSHVVSPTNQRPPNAATSPSPQRNNYNGQQNTQRNTNNQPTQSSKTFSSQNRTQPTDHELAELSEKLFNDDLSNIGRNIRLSIQSRTQSNSLVDEAPQPLLSVDGEALQKPTIKALRQLYDNYIADPSFVESVTASERQEESEFLDKVLDTTVMKEAMDFLSDQGFVQRNKKAYKDLLSLLWFTMYSRGGGIIGSSAFEHVFMGELKRDEVGGLHNWIFFANEEANHRVDYMGYLKKLDLGKKSNLLKVHFRWSNVIKHSGSMFVGTSPELEMALYTICFFTRPDDRCPLSIGGKTFGIQTRRYYLRGNRGTVIGTAYPVF